MYRDGLDFRFILLNGSQDRPNLSYASIAWYWDGLNVLFFYNNGRYGRPNFIFSEAGIDEYWNGHSLISKVL